MLAQYLLVVMRAVAALGFLWTKDRTGPAPAVFANLLRGAPGSLANEPCPRQASVLEQERSAAAWVLE